MIDAIAKRWSNKLARILEASIPDESTMEGSMTEGETDSDTGVAVKVDRRKRLLDYFADDRSDNDEVLFKFLSSRRMADRCPGNRFLTDPDFRFTDLDPENILDLHL